MTDRSYVAQNDVERKRLHALVARLSDQDLARPLSAGWTIAGVLGHLAVWDQRVITLIDEWRKAGLASPPKPEDESSVDWINDASKPFLLAVPTRRAADLALAIADAADRAVETLPEEFVARNAAAGGPINLLRAEHRRQHLVEIDAVLAS